MITSIFLLFVAAGIVVGSIVVGYGGFGAIIVGLAGIGFLATCVMLLHSSGRPSS